MNFPSSITFGLIDSSSQKAVANIAVQLTLYAHRKNNYHVGFHISDKTGTVIFTRDDCLKEICASKETFLMDYASGLEECLPRISIEVVSESQLKKSIEVRRTQKDLFQEFWDCSEEYLRRLENCDNKKYASNSLVFEEAALHKQGPLIVKVKRLE